MPESGIALPSGPTLRSFVQTIGGNPREHQGIVVCDSAGNERSVWPVTDNGGSLTVDDGGSSLTVDTSQLPAALENGRLPVSDMLHRPAYQVNTTEITSLLTAGVKENVTLWHPNTVTKTILIYEIDANFRIVNVNGAFGWELQFISAEAATPGGTVLTGQQLDRDDPNSGLVIRQLPTAAPTVTGSIFKRAYFPIPAAAAPMNSQEGFNIFEAKAPNLDDAIVLRANQAEGLRISQNVITAMATTAPIFNIRIKYLEF